MSSTTYMKKMYGSEEDVFARWSTFPAQPTLEDWQHCSRSTLANATLISDAHKQLALVPDAPSPQISLLCAYEVTGRTKGTHTTRRMLLSLWVSALTAAPAKQQLQKTAGRRNVTPRQPPLSGT